MSVKKKLIYLLDDALSVYRFDAWENSDRIANHLIAHGVTIEPTNLHPKGEWINIVDFGGGNCFGFCSVCGTEQKAQNATALKFSNKYCHWCGADMKGEGNG